MIIGKKALILAVLASLLFGVLSAHALPIAYTDARVPNSLRPVVHTGSGVYYPSGTYFFSETDLRIAARSIPMVWERHYRSNRVVRDSKGEWVFAAPTDGPMGFGWHNTWLCRIEGDSFKTANGLYINFTKDANGNYLPNTSAGFTLLKTASGYEILENGSFTYIFDTQGKLTAVRDSAGNSATLQYDADGKLNTVKDIIGRQIFSFSYNTDGRIATVTDLAGRVVSYDYDSFGNATQVRYNSSIAATYAYNTNHGITTKANGVGDSYTILYKPKWEDRGVVQKITDPAGNSSSFVYDFANRIYYHTDYSGITYKHYLNADGKLLQTEEVRNDGQNIPRTKIEYLSSRVTKITDALGNIIQTQTDEWGNTIKKTDEDGNEWRYGYDSKNNQISITDPLGTITRYEYDSNGNRTKEIQAAGTTDESIRTYSYSSFKDLLTSSNNGELTSYEYDTVGNLTKITEPEGGVTTMTYDVIGNLTSRTTPLVGSTTFENYDFKDNAGKVTDPNGAVTMYTYDQLGRIKTITSQADNGVTQYFYVGTNSGSCTSCSSSGGGTGKVSAIIFPEGNRIDYSYDTAGNLTKVTDNDGNSINYTYDNRGNKTKEEIFDVSGTLQKTVSMQYDLLNRLVKTINPDGGQIITAYNKRSSRSTIVSPNNVITTYSYDQLNRIIKASRPDDVQVAYTYDRRNNLIMVSDANGNITTYDYDKRNRMIKNISPDTGSTSYSYDRNGNLKTKTDAKQITTTYTYDTANRLMQINSPDPKDNIYYTYDTCLNGKGLLCTMVDPSGATSYEYTKKGQIAKEIKTIDSSTFTTEYGYNKNGNTTTTKYPSGRTISYSYANNKVTTIVNNGTAIATKIAYKPFGGLNALTFGNGISLTNKYDQQYRLTNLNAQGIQNLSYSYDKDGNVTVVTDNLDVSKIKTYGYDPLDRLTNAQGPWGVLGYSYDRMGNRKTETYNDVTTSYGYKPNSNLLTSVAGQKNYDFAYDGNGNTITENSRIYIYNQNQRLVRVAEQSIAKNEQGQDVTTTITKVEYTYNGKGQRVKKINNSQTTYFVFDQQGRIIEESGSTTVDYVFLDDSLLAKIENGTNSYVHVDHLGTPTKMTDEQKQLIWEISVMPFGEIFNISGMTSNHFRFPGQYYDQETGLNYNYFRDYNPSIGRYAEADPIGLYGGINLFVYVSSNPQNGIDIFGLTAKCSPHEDGIVNNPGFIRYGSNIVSRFFEKKFHCGFHCYLENRDKYCPQDPGAECCYDESKLLVTREHKYAGCMGSNDDYRCNSFEGCWKHQYDDRGGPSSPWGPLGEKTSKQYEKDHSKPPEDPYSKVRIPVLILL